LTGSSNLNWRFINHKTSERTTIVIQNTQLQEEQPIESYLGDNKEYWEKGYEAPNVDHHTFRFFGRILKPEFGLPEHNEKLLDFGCGQGAAVNFFHMNGFDAYGVDISEKDISIARSRFSHIKNKFTICNADLRFKLIMELRRTTV
jgi:cyclopropane fatty-acyl-phospholipid synthase-like methyltransferase